ncbi:MAG: MarR family winged helix-turn-helix transcriptional regulator [Burkholderiaceae bacterium]
MTNEAGHDALVLDALPGHYIRRLQQIAVAIFLEETDEYSITPVQYAALNTVSATPDIDQRSLATAIGFDTSTIGGVIDRLEARELVRRTPSPTDKRQRLLRLTPKGKKLLVQVEPLVQRAQQRMLAPLPKNERAQFMKMLRQLVLANNTHSRAPKT